MPDPIFLLRGRTGALALPDPFSCMSSMNKASLVVLREARVIPDVLAGRIAEAVQRLIDRQNASGAVRSPDYLDFEHDLIAEIGPEGSWLHVGRSRQDMLSTDVSLWLREGLLSLFDDLMDVRESLLKIASSHVTTVIPTYTHGVQAQPTSAAQYFLAFNAAMERIALRLSQGFARVSRCSLGTGAGTNSAYPINRDRLADLLGFERAVDNAYDANHITPSDSSLEVCAIVSILAAHAGQFVQDLHAQFYSAQPWLLFDDRAELNGVSSMMPQKRNPRALELIREHASRVIGAAQSMMLVTHNTHTGMTDVRDSIRGAVPFARAHTLLGLLARTVRAIVIDPKQSLAEVNRDYATMSSLTEHLIGSAGLPFRTVYKFASLLTDFGRRQSLSPNQIPFADASRIYREQVGAPIPISEAEFAATINPEIFIATRKGRGGPQPAEIERMLRDGGAALARDLLWLKDRRAAIAAADARLEQAFRDMLAHGR